jgi:hypothetical protein
MAVDGRRGRLLLTREAVAKTTLGSGASICDGTIHAGSGRKSQAKWDRGPRQSTNRDTSPTTQVPKLFRPLCATASRESSSGLPIRGCITTSTVSHPRRRQPVGWCVATKHGKGRRERTPWAPLTRHAKPWRTTSELKGLRGRRGAAAPNNGPDRATDRGLDGGVRPPRREVGPPSRTRLPGRPRWPLFAAIRRESERRAHGISWLRPVRVRLR